VQSAREWEKHASPPVVVHSGQDIRGTSHSSQPTLFYLNSTHKNLFFREAGNRNGIQANIQIRLKDMVFHEPRNERFILVATEGIEDRTGDFILAVLFRHCREYSRRLLGEAAERF
jgi:hypothetical protein